jgi:hypothetical protein
MADKSSGEQPIKPAASLPVQAVVREATVSQEVTVTEEDLPPGWTTPRDIVPAPTYWPVIAALAVSLVGFGLATTIIISGVGVILFGVALAGWIGDIRREQHEHGHTQPGHVRTEQ